MIEDKVANGQLLMLNDINSEIMEAYFNFFNVRTKEALENKLIEFYGYSVQ